MEKHAPKVIVLEELLIATTLAVLAVLLVSHVRWRDLLPGEFDLYRMIGRKSAPVAVSVQLGTLVCVPVGLIGGLLFARRTFLYMAVPAAGLLAFAGYAMAAKSEPVFLASALLVLAAMMFAGAAVGRAIRKHTWRPRQGARRTMSGGQWLWRAVADVVLALFVVANLTVWMSALAGGALARHFAADHPVFLLLPLAVSALARYALRDRFVSAARPPAR